MRKNLTKLIKSSLPPLFDEEGEVLSRDKIANKVLDNIPHPERLGLLPFEVWVPFVCSVCEIYNRGRNGCAYDLFDETFHQSNLPPANCPLGYK